MVGEEKEVRPLEFFTVYLAAWWWTQLWFRSCIQNKQYKERFDEIIRADSFLQRSRILTQENRAVVVAHLKPFYSSVALLTQGGKNEKAISSLNFRKAITALWPFITPLSIYATKPVYTPWGCFYRVTPLGYNLILILTEYIFLKEVNVHESAYNKSTCCNIIGLS
jgi:hypothetical protein